MPGHEHADVVPPAGEPVGVGEDGAHASGDPKMRAQERDLHGEGHDPLDVAGMPACQDYMPRTPAPTTNQAWAALRQSLLDAVLGS
jgi:hypothetical protein